MTITKITVKCEKCGSEYTMPMITTDKVVMKECPNCKITIPKDLEKFFK